MRYPRLQACFTLAAVLTLCLMARLLWLTIYGDMAIIGNSSGGASNKRHPASSAGDSGPAMVKRGAVVVKDDKSGQVLSYHSEMPLVFVGGFPRSGTTLMRAMLDAHPDVRCGEETRVIPNILSQRQKWIHSDTERRRLLEAGVTDEVLDAAISSFILEVMVKHGQPAPRLCNKDPFVLKWTEYMSHLYPNAKFVLMIRDGRAIVHSMITRNVGVGGYDLTDPRQCLEKWNQSISEMYRQCFLVGSSRCKPVHYEQLILHPEKHMKDLLQFLDLPWNSSVLHHEMFIGKEISLSKTEKSTSQVVKPVNTDALTAWVGTFPQDIIEDMSEIAPMLAQLGYDPDANPPNYGKADDFVLRKTEDVHKNQNYWEQKVDEVLERKRKPTPPAKRVSNEAPTAYYGEVANNGVGVVAKKTLPKVTKKKQDDDDTGEGEENTARLQEQGKPN